MNGKFNIIFSPSWLRLLLFFAPFIFETKQRRTFDAEIRISFKNLPIDLKEILRITNFQIIQIPIEHCISCRLHLLFFFPFFFAYFILFATLPIQFYSILSLILPAAWNFFCVRLRFSKTLARVFLLVRLAGGTFASFAFVLQQ